MVDQETVSSNTPPCTTRAVSNWNLHARRGMEVCNADELEGVRRGDAASTWKQPAFFHSQASGS